MSNECTNEFIKKNMDIICKYVEENCEYSYFNFYYLHYCYLHSNIWITLPILFLIGFLCFYLLSDTSNKFLSNALSLLSEKMKISQNLAAITFLAFGNGAPDVISSIVAGESPEGIDFTIGALMGAGLFVTCFVLSSVVFFAKKVNVNKGMFIRDICLYLFTIGVLCLFSLNGKINLIESILFFSIYIIFIIIAIIQDRCYGNPNTIVNIGFQELLADDILNEFDVVHNDLPENDAKSIRTEYSYYTNIIKEDHFYNDVNSTNKNLIISHKKRRFTVLDYYFTSIRYKIKRNFNRIKLTKSSGLFRKFFYYAIDLPLTFIRRLTIPPCQLEFWNKDIFIFIPLFGFVFIVLITSSYSFLCKNLSLTFIFLFVFMCLWVSIVIKYTFSNRLPSCEVLLCLGTFIMTMFWIWFTSQILIDILQIIGVIFNIDQAYLAMTLLAYGNSIPDLIINCSLAKSGYGEMGLAGSIVGPLFNLIIGLGFSLIQINLSKGEIVFSLFDFDKRIIIFISIVTLSINLLLLLIQAFLYKFKLVVGVSYIGLCLYVLYSIAIFYFTFFYNK